MSGLDQAFLVLGMAIVTFLIRYPVLAIFGKLSLPPLIMRSLKYVPAAVLSAIIVPAVLIPDGTHINVSTSNAYLIGGVIATVAAWRTKNLLLTIVLGMVSMWGWRALTGQ